MTDMIGKYLGRYHIREQLGEGGMATVYKAYDTRLERYVAIKIIRSDQVGATDFQMRFEREAKALAQLSHPNIVTVLDYGEQDGMPYLVMEYIAGASLKSIVGRQLDYREAARLLLPIASALGYAHSHKIVHRDVKPGNVLIDEAGNPMLLDFGISKMLEANTDAQITSTGVGIGTPEYMAPEQGLGDPVDWHADIYALGVIFYELITGQRPFKADTPLAVILKQIYDPLPPARNLVPGLPEVVDDVLSRALAKSPADRYPDMDSFISALRLLCGDEPAQPVLPPAVSEQVTVIDRAVIDRGVTPIKEVTPAETPLLTPSRPVRMVTEIESPEVVPPARPKGINPRLRNGIILGTLGLVAICALSFVFFGGWVIKTFWPPNVAVTVNAPTSVNVGETFVYKISIQNTGNRAVEISEIGLDEDFFNGVKVLAISPETFGKRKYGGNINYKLDQTIQPGETLNVVMQLQAVIAGSYDTNFVVYSGVAGYYTHYQMSIK